MSKPLLFDQSLDKLFILFRYSGMNLSKQIVNPMDFIKYRSLYTFNFLWALSACIVSVYYIYIGMVKGKSFSELTSVAPCIAFTVLAMIKSIFHMIYEENLQQLIVLLRDLEIKENEREHCSDKEKIIVEETDFLSRVIYVLYVLNCTMIVVFDMTPLILIAIKYYKTKKFEMLLPYMDVFEFIPYELKYWPFAYVHQIWSECVALLLMGATDYLYFTFCTYIRLQFRLLKIDFERIISVKSISQKEIFQEDEFRDKFAELVKLHLDLIRSTNILETVYSKSTLFNFLSSSLVICLTGFNATIVNDIVITITYLTFLFMGLMQVFFLCFFADMMSKASTEICNAVYNSKWYIASPGVGRQLWMVQTRAQKPCKLTAAGFADVNLHAFMRVLSTAWSYFALLQTVYSGKSGPIR